MSSGTRGKLWWRRVAVAAVLAGLATLVIHGDTMKDPLDRSGWPDGTVGNGTAPYDRHLYPN